MVSNTESQSLVVRRVRVLRARTCCSTFVTKLESRGTHSCFAATLLQDVAWRSGWELQKKRHIEVKWLQQATDEKKLATKHVPTESNIADIGTKGFTSDRIRNLMNQMEMSLVAGMECLVQQPMEKTHRDVDS